MEVYSWLIATFLNKKNAFTKSSLLNRKQNTKQQYEIDSFFPKNFSEPAVIAFIWLNCQGSITRKAIFKEKIKFLFVAWKSRGPTMNITLIVSRF